MEIEYNKELRDRALVRDTAPLVFARKKHYALLHNW